MSHNPQSAKALIALMIAACIGTIGYGLAQANAWHGYEALVLLAVSVIASRMKIKLPGLTGTMSVNLPFLLLAVSELNLVEALAVACATAVVQTFPKNWARPEPEKLLFNASTMSVAAAMAWQVLHSGVASHAQGPVLLSLATVSFFLGQTLPVSTIIALTGGGPWRRVWMSMAQLSFPYFVLSAGVASMVATGRYLGWQIPFVALPLMFGVFRSYQLYFRAQAAGETSLVMAASAGR